MKIIDVRSKQEYDQQHVEGALWFDVERLIAGELPPVDTDEELILYCRSGARSTMAKHLLESKGYTNVTSGGGLGHMAARGFNVVR